MKVVPDSLTAGSRGMTIWDERREVLIFKMAVALGFDAPRAFTLVSMRASRDPEFGVQLVGRILRVHRRLQGRAQAKKLPEFLSDGRVLILYLEGGTRWMTVGYDLQARKPILVREFRLLDAAGF